MTWFDNLIGAFWILLQILLWVGALIIVGLILAIIVSAIWDGAMKRKEPERKTLIGAAEATAISRYRLKPDASHVTAFVEGAEYMWEHLHPTRKK